MVQADDTALALAARFGHLDVIKALLEHKVFLQVGAMVYYFGVVVSGACNFIFALGILKSIPSAFLGRFCKQVFLIIVR